MERVDHLTDIAEQLRTGKEVPVVPVREFLAWFDVQRPDDDMVERIRQALSNAKLLTTPDFASTDLDTSMRFSLTPEPPGAQVVSSQAVFMALTVSEPRVMLSEPHYVDPTYL